MGKKILALDIGASSIKALEIVKAKNTVTVNKYAQIATPEDNADLPRVINKLLQTNDIRAKKVVTSISLLNTMYRISTVPRAKDKKLFNKVVKHHIQTLIPFELEEVIWDFQVEETGVSLSIPENQVIISLMAARKTIIEERLALLEQVKLKPLAIDSGIGALANAFKASDLVNQTQEVTAIVDIGGSFTNVIIMIDHLPVYCRGRMQCGDTFTEAISKNLEIDFAKAELLKKQPGKRAAEIQEILEDSIEELAREVYIYFDLFEHQYEKKVEKILLSGGGSLVPHLKTYFEELCELEVIPWNPLELFALKINAPQLDVSAGLLTRFLPAFSHNKKFFNLLGKKTWGFF